jgi:hypothetical protein
MKQTVYMFRCENSVVQIKSKINSVTVDGCKKTSVVFDNLLSQVEVTNSQGIEVQTLGTLPIVSIQKTDGCQVYLSNEVNEEVKYDKNRWNTFISAKTEFVMGIMTTIAKTQHLQRKTFNLNENFDLCWETIWSLTNIPIRLDLSKRCLQNSLKFSSNQQFNNILNAKLTTVINQRYNYLARHTQPAQTNAQSETRP